MQFHAKCPTAVIFKLINVDVKLNGYGKASNHCWFAHTLKLNILNAEKYYTRISYLPQVNCQD